MMKKFSFYNSLCDLLLFFLIKINILDRILQCLLIIIIIIIAVWSVFRPKVNKTKNGSIDFDSKLVLDSTFFFK